MRAPTVVESGQLVCALLVLVGLFMLLPLPWFLVVTGALGLALFWAIEHKQASATPIESDGS